MARKTVLVVDDDANTRGSYTTVLERSGYRVLEASNGGEAIRMARTRSPQAILMDIGMPVMDGLSAAETLKGDPDTAGIPIVMVTAHTLRRERERMESISEGHLYKPCAPEQLLTELRRCLDLGESG